MPTEMKDGLGNEFTLVTKDQSLAQDNKIRQNWHLASKMPVDHTNGGAYQITMKSNTMAAGLAANSPIISFRLASASLVAVIRRMELSVWSLGTGFAAGLASFDALAARLYSSEDSGGLLAALSGNVGKLRTNMQTTSSHLRVSDTATLTVGTRTLDAHPFETLNATITNATNTVFINDQMLFTERDHPLILQNAEGVIVQATVPATGIWGFNVMVAWDEIESQRYQ